MIVRSLVNPKSILYSDIETDYKLIDEKPGVYIVTCLSEDLSPIVFRRLGEDDREGILYIGTSGNRGLQGRICDFYDDMKTGKGHHSGVWTFYLNFENNKTGGKPLDKHDIKIWWECANDPERADERETELLLNYNLEFQDNPPLNTSRKRGKMEKIYPQSD